MALPGRQRRAPPAARSMRCDERLGVWRRPGRGHAHADDRRRQFVALDRRIDHGRDRDRPRDQAQPVHRRLRRIASATAPEMPSSGAASTGGGSRRAAAPCTTALRLRQRVAAGLGRRRADQRRGGGGGAGIGRIESGEPGRRHDGIDGRISLRAREQARRPLQRVAPGRQVGRGHRQRRRCDRRPAAPAAAARGRCAPARPPAAAGSAGDRRPAAGTSAPPARPPAPRRCRPRSSRASARDIARVAASSAACPCVGEPALDQVVGLGRLFDLVLHFPAHQEHELGPHHPLFDRQALRLGEPNLGRQPARRGSRAARS